MGGPKRLRIKLFFDRDLDRIPVFVSFKCAVGSIGKLKTQGVFTRLKLHGRFGGTVPEMNMLFIRWYDFSGWHKIGVHQYVHVASAFLYLAGRNNLDALSPHFH